MGAGHYRPLSRVPSSRNLFAQGAKVRDGGALREVLRRHGAAMAERALAFGVGLAEDAFVFSSAPDGVGALVAVATGPLTCLTLQRDPSVWRSGPIGAVALSLQPPALSPFAGHPGRENHRAAVRRCRSAVCRTRLRGFSGSGRRPLRPRLHSRPGADGECRHHQRVRRGGGPLRGRPRGGGGQTVGDGSGHQMGQLGALAVPTGRPASTTRKCPSSVTPPKRRCPNRRPPPLVPDEH